MDEKDIITEYEKQLTLMQLMRLQGKKWDEVAESADLAVQAIKIFTEKLKEAVENESSR